LKAGDDRAARVRALYPVRAWLRDGSEIVIRPIGPEDAASEQAFTQALSAESRYFRFMSTLRELPADMLHRFTHPDFDREVALIALAARPRSGARSVSHAASLKTRSSMPSSLWWSLTTGRSAGWASCCCAN